MEKSYLFLLLFPLLTSAHTITFQEAKSLALKNSDELKAKKLSIEMITAEYESVKAMEWGKATFSSSFQRTDNAMYVFGAKLSSREATFADFGFADFLKAWPNNNPLPIQPHDLNYPKARNISENALTYELPLFTGFKLSLGQSMLALQKEGVSAKFLHDERLMAKEVLQTYNGAVAAKNFIQALSKGKEATKSFVKTADDFFAAGMVVKSDILQAKSYDANIDAKMVEAKNQLALALAYLRFLTGDESLSDVGDFQTVSLENVAIPDVETLIKNRQDLQWMKANVKTMETKVSYDKSDRYPMIGLQAKYGFYDQQPTLSMDKDYYAVGLGLTYNLFDGGKLSADIQKSALSYQQTQHYYQLMTKGALLEAQKAKLSYESSKEIVKYKEVAQLHADAIVTSTLEMYKNGLAPMSLLLLKEAEAQKAKAELIQARYDEVMAAATFKLAIGGDI